MNYILRPLSLLSALVLLALVAAHAPALAREAAFMDPGLSASGGDGSEAIKVEPKGDVDIGETILGVSKRTTMFFTNQTAMPIQIEKIAVNGDGNVAVETTNNDCQKQQTLSTQSRCSIELSITPSSPGAWSVDVLMTHNGPGRIVRAKVSGKTTGTASTGEKNSMGLTMNSKEASPINFGDVDTGDSKAVRSALMINDSTEPISILSIDVIEADNGLQRLEQGCAVDMELKPGESCPVTLLWAPQAHSNVSTDLIIRHTGKMGFTVIPVRGNAKGEGKAGIAKNSADQDNKVVVGSHAAGSVPAPSSVLGNALPLPPLKNGMDAKSPSAPDDLEKSAEKIAASALTPAASPEVKIHLIGTVGNRAILLKGDGTTLILGAGDTIDTGSQTSKTIVTSVSARSVDITTDGNKKTYPLETANDLVNRAKEASTASNKSEGTGGSAAKPDTTNAPGGNAPGNTLGKGNAPLAGTEAKLSGGGSQ